MLKSFRVLLVIGVMAMLNSCATTFYQVYEVNSNNKINFKKDALIYEDKNCSLTYNFWSNGGDIGFIFHNKTNKNIYINLQKSFFIVNGFANDYYKERIYTNSKSTGISAANDVFFSKAMRGFNNSGLVQTNQIAASKSTGAIATTGYSVTHNEQKEVCIPANTSKIISEYSIKDNVYRDCDLYRFPNKKQINTVTYSKAESPYVFGNRIIYFIENDEEEVQIDNEFYVSEITNYPEKEITESRPKEFCKEKSTTKYLFFKDVTPYKFYIKYSKDRELWKH